MSRRSVPSCLATIAAAVLPATLLLAPEQAAAQSATFYLDRLPIAGAPDDGLAVWRPQFGPTRFFGQLGAGYSVHPLHAVDLTGSSEQAAVLNGSPVATQVTGYLTAGVELNRRGALQLTLPITVFQQGSAVDNAGAGLPQAVSLARSAVADTRLDARILLLRSDSGLFKLGARGAVFLPTGDVRSFTGEGMLWGDVSLAGELDFKSLFVTVNAGASIRPVTTLAHLTTGSALTYGAAAYLPVMDQRLHLGAELFGSFGIVSQSDGNPLEAALHGRLFFNDRHTGWIGAAAGTRLLGGVAPDFRAVFLLGGAFVPPTDAPSVPRLAPRALPETDADKDGLPDIADTCPEEPDDDFRPGDGCPQPADIDKDGILNKADRCPDTPEDKDGVDDEDGCPEVDADEDGIADADDKCPKEPGAHSDDPEKEGCPRFIRKLESEVQLKKQVDFDFGKSTIQPQSFPMLDEVVRLLKVNPDIQRLDIEGHTDNIGAPAHNDLLSQTRAEAVRQYLIKNGIDQKRLFSKGFGASRPVAPNDTEEGRAKNRRVELNIVHGAVVVP